MAVPEGLASLIWVAACAVIAPAWLGFGIVQAVGLSPAVHGRRAAWAYGYIVGHYTLAHVTLLWLIAGKPVPGVVLPAAAVAIGSALLLWVRRRRQPAAAVTGRSPWWAWVILLLLAAWLVDACLLANVQPVQLGDEAEIWAAKAKVLYCAPHFDLGFGLCFYVVHADYPPLNPLVQVLAFASAGRVLQFENRIPVQGFAFALLLLLASALERRSHPAAAVAVLIAFAGSQFANCAVTGNADVMLACVTLAAVDALLRFFETGERVWFRLSCIALGAMLLSKNEGDLLALAVTVPFVFGWVRDRRRGRGPLPGRALAWLLVPAGALLLHRGFNAWFNLRNDLFDPAIGNGLGLFARIAADLSARLGSVTAFYGDMLVDPAQQRLLLLLFAIAFMVAVATGRRQLAAEARLLGVVVFAIAGYMLVFIGTRADLQWHLLTAADRTVLHVLPVAALGLAMTAWPRQVRARGRPGAAMA
jgi:Dolichyl-phosphate-mannose-protein mannosyltransferase